MEPVLRPFSLVIPFTVQKGEISGMILIPHQEDLQSGEGQKSCTNTVTMQTTYVHPYTDNGILLGFIS